MHRFYGDCRISDFHRFLIIKQKFAVHWYLVPLVVLLASYRHYIFDNLMQMKLLEISNLKLKQFQNK